MKNITTNKRAFFEYTIIDKYTAGIQLLGSEVKSIRNGKVSISESYCFITNGEIFIKGMNVSIYDKGGVFNNHIPLRNRKLLLNKKEIINLQEKSSQKGLTIVPLEIFFSDTGLIKVLIGLAKGKNTYDKKETIKKRDLDRELNNNI